MNSSHTTRTAVPSRRISTRDLAFAGMIAAILAIISQISVPMPTGVPITIQVFGITLIGVAFGWRLGLYGSLVYCTGGFNRRIYLVLASHGGTMRTAD